MLHTMLAICTTSFRVVQLMYRPLWQYTTILGLTLLYVYKHTVCHYAPYDVTNMQDMLRSCTLDVCSHAFNFNNHNPILFYKPALWFSMLHTMMVLLTTSYGVVQLMYTRLWWFKTTLSLTFLYVYELSLYQYTAYGVTNLQNKFWIVTLNVHFNSINLSNHYPTL